MFEMKTVSAPKRKSSVSDGTQFKFIADKVGAIRWDGNETLFECGDTVLIQTTRDRRTTAKVNGEIVATTLNMVVVNREQAVSL